MNKMCLSLLLITILCNWLATVLSVLDFTKQHSIEIILVNQCTSTDGSKNFF
jgi:hypothetical protein